PERIEERKKEREKQYSKIREESERSAYNSVSDVEKKDLSEVYLLDVNYENRFEGNRFDYKKLGMVEPLDNEDVFNRLFEPVLLHEENTIPGNNQEFLLDTEIEDETEVHTIREETERLKKTKADYFFGKLEEIRFAKSYILFKLADKNARIRLAIDIKAPEEENKRKAIRIKPSADTQITGREISEAVRVKKTEAEEKQRKEQEKERERHKAIDRELKHHQLLDKRKKLMEGMVTSKTRMDKAETVFSNLKTLDASDAYALDYNLPDEDVEKKVDICDADTFSPELLSLSDTIYSNLLGYNVKEKNFYIKDAEGKRYNLSELIEPQLEKSKSFGDKAQRSKYLRQYTRAVILHLLTRQEGSGLYYQDKDKEIKVESFAPPIEQWQEGAALDPTELLGKFKLPDKADKEDIREKTNEINIEAEPEKENGDGKKAAQEFVNNFEKLKLLRGKICSGLKAIKNTLSEEGAKDENTYFLNDGGREYRNLAAAINQVIELLDDEEGMKPASIKLAVNKMKELYTASDNYYKSHKPGAIKKLLYGDRYGGFKHQYGQVRLERAKEIKDSILAIDRGYMTLLDTFPDDYLEDLPGKIESISDEQKIRADVGDFDVNSYIEVNKYEVMLRNSIYLADNDSAIMILRYKKGRPGSRYFKPGFGMKYSQAAACYKTMKKLEEFDSLNISVQKARQIYEGFDGEEFAGEINALKNNPSFINILSTKGNMAFDEYGKHEGSKNISLIKEENKGTDQLIPAIKDRNEELTQKHNNNLHIKNEREDDNRINVDDEMINADQQIPLIRKKIGLAKDIIGPDLSNIKSQSKKLNEE
ncbi:MAG: hypothetical protein J6N76_00145, partial [Lachnospiraceae bacterium]|nr:hypothetical protein [Lachnospiraceae bacterium]